MKKYIKQINNIKIYQTADFHYRFTCFSPDGRALEEFRYQSDAELWAKGIKDFVSKK